MNFSHISLNNFLVTKYEHTVHKLPLYIALLLDHSTQYSLRYLYTGQVRYAGSTPHQWPVCITSQSGCRSKLRISLAWVRPMAFHASKPTG